MHAPRKACARALACINLLGRFARVRQDGQDHVSDIRNTRMPPVIRTQVLQRRQGSNTKRNARLFLLGFGRMHIRLVPPRVPHARDEMCNHTLKHLIIVLVRSSAYHPHPWRQSLQDFDGTLLKLIHAAQMARSWLF